MHKNLSHILHRCHGMRESKRYLRSFFPEIHQILGEFYQAISQLVSIWSACGYSCTFLVSLIYQSFLLRIVLLQAQTTIIFFTFRSLVVLGSRHCCQSLISGHFCLI
jgi:hypothetical protein